MIQKLKTKIFLDKKTLSKNIHQKNNTFIKNKIYNFNLSNNMGFYIPHAILNPELSSEYIDDLFIMTRSLDRNLPSNNNIFKWNCFLHNPIMNLIYIYPHILSIPICPFITKNFYNISIDVFDFLSSNIVIPDKTYDVLDKKISICCVYNIELEDTKPYHIIDYIIDYDSSKLYSIDLKKKQNFLYVRSNKRITDNGFLNIDIDPNNNMQNNLLSTTKGKHFTFKFFPLIESSTYMYYWSCGQYVFKTINELQNIKNLNITISSNADANLTNYHVNWKLNKLCHCFCMENNIFVPSCHCTYIRHPYHSQNQIDVGFKIGIVKNEQLTEVFTKPN